MLSWCYHRTVSPMKYDIFRTGRSSASSGKSFFQIPARKKRYKLSFNDLSICRFATNQIISISSQLAAGSPNAQFGKTQFFWDTLYYVPIKALWGQNEGWYFITLTEGPTHFRKYLIAGIIQRHSRILETFSLMLIKAFEMGWRLALLLAHGSL